MRLLINEDIYGWRMTGLIDKQGRWFAGVSYAPSQKITQGTFPEPGKDFCDCKGIVGNCGLCDNACRDNDVR